jgi:hypothetical protein
VPPFHSHVRHFKLQARIFFAFLQAVKRSRHWARQEAPS